MWYAVIGTTTAQTLNGDNPTMTENFNSMYDATASAATLPLPQGWRIDRNMDAVRSVGAYDSAAEEVMYEGGISLASNAKNGTWNFQSSSDVTDRAVGGITTGSVGGANAGTRCLSVMTKITNGDAKDIEGLKISYDVEKYRNGSNAAGFTVQMYYSTDGTEWVSAGDDFKTSFTPDATTAGAEVVPISTNRVSEKNLKATITSGSDLYLAWNISVSTGTTCSSAMALAIDNVSVTATFANPDVAKHYIYVENATKWANLYLYASGADEPFGAQPGSQPAGGTNINGVEYKYYEVTTTGTYSLVFSDGGSTNKYDAVSVTTDKDNYLSVNPLGVDVIADPQTYTGWVDPTRPPFVSSGIFVRGELNSWGAPAEWEFSKEADGLYVLYDKTLSGNFKVADANWSSACNYGSNGSPIEIDNPYTLTGGVDTNISCGSNTYACAKIVLTISGGTATLLLQSDNDDTGLTAVYVIGDNNGWNYADDSGKLILTSEPNVFKGRVTMPAGSDGLSHWLIYQKLGMGGPWGAPGNTDMTGNNTSGTLEKGSKGTVSTQPGTYDVTFNLSTGAYGLTLIPSEIQSLTIMPAEVTLVPAVPEQVRVLSLNNSLIDYNNQDFMFNDIAKAMGKDAVWTKHTNLGKPLSYHWEEGEETTSTGAMSAKALIRSEAWTHIILQEQSALPRTNIEAFRNNVKTWLQFIRENCPNPHAVVIVPVNWAYSGDWANFTDFNKKFVENCQNVARETGITLCPVGVAYQNVYDKEGTTGIAPWFQDDRHPTNMSTYMAACMEYGLIFGEDPVTINSHPTSISDANAESMRSYASEALKGFTNYVDHTAGMVRYSVVAVDQFGMELVTPADLAFTIDGGGSIDGTVFTSDGTDGTFTLTATSGGFTSTATLNVVDAVPAAIQGPTAPEKGLTLTGNNLLGEGQIEVYTTDGSIVKRGYGTVSLSGCDRGIYLVRTTGKDGTRTAKIVR